MVRDSCTPFSLFFYQYLLISPRHGRLMTTAACQSICKFESDFSALPLSLFKLKNRHWWNNGAKYHRINYLIKVIIGAADISFELWHNGARLSEDNSIKVEWQTTAPPAPDANPVVADFPMSVLPTAAVPTQGRVKTGG